MAATTVYAWLWIENYQYISKCVFLAKHFKGFLMTCLWSFRVHFLPQIMMGSNDKLPALFFSQTYFPKHFWMQQLIASSFYGLCLSVLLSVKRCIVTKGYNRLSVYRHQYDFVFDHFGPNIIAEDNRLFLNSHKIVLCVPTLYRAKRFRFNNQLFAVNHVIAALCV